uniref:Uncharacterized protein n=1 Tax=Rhizophora mucronata TaxID=61149 RepID=A0A2P2PEB6_RHIMU
MMFISKPLLMGHSPLAPSTLAQSTCLSLLPTMVLVLVMLRKLRTSSSA